MIEELDTRPEDIFDPRIDDSHHWLRMHLNGVTYAYIALKIVGEESAIHLEFQSWSKSILKELLADWENILYACKKAGATSIIAANPDYEDKRWPKFIKHFGFPKPDIIAISKQPI